MFVFLFLMLTIYMPVTIARLIFWATRMTITLGIPLAIATLPVPLLVVLHSALVMLVFLVAIIIAYQVLKFLYPAQKKLMRYLREEDGYKMHILVKVPVFIFNIACAALPSFLVTILLTVITVGESGMNEIVLVAATILALLWGWASSTIFPEQIKKLSDQAKASTYEPGVQYVRVIN